MIRYSTPVDGESELVAQYMGLVCSLAHRFSGMQFEYDDAKSAGSMGLLRAARRWLTTEDHTHAFGTLAHLYIRSSIIDHYRRTVGRHGQRAAFCEYISEMEEQDDFGNSERQYIGGDVELEAHTNIIGESVWEAVSKLPERDAWIISMYYRDGLRMAEIAKVVGVSESRIAQLHSAAIKRLRGEMLAQGYASMPVVDARVAI